MKKINWVLVCIVMLFVGFLSGCQEESTPTENNISDKIELESDVVELIFADFIEHGENGNTVRIEVQYLFKNIAGRDISIKVNVEFYDEEDNLLYKSENKTANYPEGYFD